MKVLPVNKLMKKKCFNFIRINKGQYSAKSDGSNNYNLSTQKCTLEEIILQSNPSLRRMTALRSHQFPNTDKCPMTDTLMSTSLPHNFPWYFLLDVHERPAPFCHPGSDISWTFIESRSLSLGAWWIHAVHSYSATYGQLLNYLIIVVCLRAIGG